MSAAIPVPLQSIPGVEPSFSYKLWEKAFGTLDSHLKTSLAQTNDGKLDILTAVLQAAEEKRKVCLNKRWKYKGANGEEVILRDVLEKLVRWINRFVFVGDTAVQYNPTAAALPWAAVRFLLLATTNDIQLFGAMVSDLEVIARLIVRYREFEMQHLQQPCAMRDVLGEALTSLYSGVLTYLGRAVIFFTDSTAVRVAKNIFRTADEYNLQAILAKDDEVMKLAQLTDTVKLNTISDSVRKMAYQLEESERVVEKNRYIRLLRWLSVSPYPQHHQAVADKRPPDSGQWLLEHAEFQGWWTSSSSSILMLHGIAGAGKTHLCSVVVDALLKATSSDALAAPFAYFYCSSSCAFEPERASPDEVLRSLLRQLAARRREQPWVSNILWSEYERRSAAAEVDGFELAPLQAEDCVRLILELAMTDPVTIVVDALDEIRETDRHTLLAAFTSIVSEAENVVKVFVTGRTSSSIMAALPHAHMICIGRKETRADMEVFIGTLLDHVLAQKRLLGGQISPGLRTAIQDALLDKAGEMFLWAELQVEQLCWLNHQNDVLDALRAETIPKLDEMYENILNQILQSGKAARELAINVFSWTLYMCQPLTPQVLLAAVSGPLEASDHDDRLSVPRLLRLCFNLVLVDAECNVIRFIHGSVQAFFQGHALFFAAASHRRLTAACLESCKMDLPNELLSPVWPSDTFYHYAVMYWPVHFQSSLVTDAKDDLFLQLLSFIFDGDLDTSPSFDQWLDSLKSIVNSLPVYHAMWKSLSAVPNSTRDPMFVSAVFGLDGVLHHLATEDTAASRHWDEKNEQDHTALYLASYWGHTTAVAFLLERGADINVTCGRHGKPLFAACFNGHYDVVTLLLEHGASTTDGTPFNGALNASFRGQQEHIALFLVQHADVITTADDFEFAVRGAAELGFGSLMQYLQKLPQFISGQQVLDKKQALSAKAIRGGRLLMLQRHLHTSDDPTANMPPDSVAMAVLHGHVDVVRYLLDMGMSAEKGGLFGPPLRTASLMNQLAIAELLLKRGASVNSGGPLGNALYVAAMKGHMSIARLLLNHGASVRQEGAFYGNALQAAAFFGHKNVVELLLSSDMMGHSQNFVQGAFSAAAEGGHENVLQCLIDKGYNFRIIWNGHLYSCSMEVKSHQNSRPKSWIGHEADFAAVFAAASGVQSAKLSEADTAVTTPGYMDDNEDNTEDLHPLIIGADAGHTAVVQFYLQQKEAISEIFMRAANKAAKKNNLNVVRVLFEHAVTKSQMKGILRSVLEVAKNTGTTETTDFSLYIASSQGVSYEDEFKQYAPPPPPIDEGKVVPTFINSCKSGDRCTIRRILASEHAMQLDRITLRHGLQLAATHGSLTITHTQLDSGSIAEKRSTAKDSFASTAANGHVEDMKHLVENQPELCTGPAIAAEALLAACTRGHVNMVRYLLSEVAAVDANALSKDTGDPEALAFISPLQAVLRLFEAARPPSAFDTHNMHSTSEVNYASLETITTLLLDYGANPNECGGRDRYPIQVAAKYCPVVILERLLVAGANVNIPSGADHSALGAAVLREIDARLIVSRLLDAGAVLPQDSTGRKRLLGDVLGLFVCDPSQAPFFDEIDVPDGRFLFITSLDYVFQHGPGAVLMLLLSKFPQEEAHDLRYGLVLQMAALAGQLEPIRLLLSRGVDVNIAGYYDGTALKAAARFGQDRIVHQLLVAGAADNVSQGRWHTALEAAVASNKDTIVEILLKYGANDCIGTRRLYKDRYLLQLAVTSNNDRTVQRLLSAGAEAALAREKPKPATLLLKRSIKRHNMLMVNALLRADVPIDTDPLNNMHMRCYCRSILPLHVAAEYGHVDILHLLLEHGANPEGCIMDHWFECDTPLALAVDNGHHGAAQALLAAGARLTCSSRWRCRTSNILSVASQRQDLRMIEVLLDAARARDEVESLIDEAYSGKNDKQIDGDISQYDSMWEVIFSYVKPTTSRLFQACTMRAVSAVIRMLEQGLSVDTQDEKSGCSLLYISALVLQEDLVRLLLSHGAGVNSMQTQFGTPLTAAMLGYWAIVMREKPQRYTQSPQRLITKLQSSLPVFLRSFFGHGRPDISHCEAVATLLMDGGVDISIGCEEFGQPLCLASLIGSSTIVKQLLDRGANVHAQSRRWKTALFAAIEGCNPDIVSLLLQYGADPNQADDKLGTPLHYANNVGVRDTIDQLIKHGALDCH